MILSDQGGGRRPSLSGRLKKRHFEMAFRTGELRDAQARTVETLRKTHLTLHKQDGVFAEFGTDSWRVRLYPKINGGADTFVYERVKNAR